MNKEELFSEERYQQSKKKIIRISILLVIVGIIAGAGFITTGILKMTSIKKQREIEAAELNEEAETTKAANEKRIEELEGLISSTQKENDDLELEIKKLRNEQTKIFTEDRGFSDRYYAKDEEIAKKQQELRAVSTKLSAYKQELSSLKSKVKVSTFISTNNVDSSIDSSRYIPFITFGIFVIISTGMISLFIYLTAKRREIAAFTLQQTRPIAEESMEMVSKATGDIAREVAKGIEEGKAQAKVPHVVRCPHCGADNEIIGRTGKCEYCQSKISVKE